MITVPADLAPLERLRFVLKSLRAPEGCPWDREQTLATLKPCLQEEAYELLDVMAGDDLPAHAEELGDVLLQVVFQAQIREESGQFSLDDVMTALTEKLIRRHPHVFGSVTADSTDAVLRNWEQIKQTEKKDKPRHSALDGVPEALPALLKAQRTQAKASRVGFDWDTAEGASAKVDEELAEVREAIAANDPQHIKEEIGDLFFAIVNLCRFLKIDAEDALRMSTAKFSRRFREIESRVKASGREMKNCTLAELDVIWDTIKREEKNKKI